MLTVMLVFSFNIQCVIKPESVGMITFISQNLPAVPKIPFMIRNTFMMLNL